MSEKSFWIEIEPKGKARARVARTASGRTIAYTPAPTREYENAIKVRVAYAWRPRPTIRGAITVAIEAVMPIPQSWSRTRRSLAARRGVDHTSRPDLDNIVKGVLDAMRSVVYDDDTQVVEINANKRYGITPGIMVTVLWQP